MLETLLAATANGHLEPADVALSLRSRTTSARVMKALQPSMADRRRQLSGGGQNPVEYRL